MVIISRPMCLLYSYMEPLGEDPYHSSGFDIERSGLAVATQRGPAIRLDKINA